MGMYHYAYNRRLNVDISLDTTSFVPVPPQSSPYRINACYRAHCGYWRDEGERITRLGTVLQSYLRRRGYAEKLKPVAYEYFGKNRWFTGHTYVDKSAIPLLQEFAQQYRGHYWIEELIILVQKYPGRWYLYGDDMCEPRPWMDKNRRSRNANAGKLKGGVLVIAHEV